MPQLLSLRRLGTGGRSRNRSGPEAGDLLETGSLLETDGLGETVGARIPSARLADAGDAAQAFPDPAVPATPVSTSVVEPPADPLGPLDIDPRMERTAPLTIIAPRRIGESDLIVHPLALGASVFGWTADGETSHAVLDRFAALGGDFIDTADSYASGRSEVLIGTWMRARRNRDRVVVATKVGGRHGNPGLGSAGIVRAVEASLERLHTDRIDLLFFHDDDPETPLEGSLAAAERLIAAGKVRFLAASDFSADRLLEARVLASSGLPKFVAVQTQYNLMHRAEFESALRIVAAAQGLAVMPYCALANGFLTGKYRSRADLAADVRSVRASAYVNRKGMRVLAVLDRIAAEHRVAPASVAIAWLLAKRTIVAPVASASRPRQVDALLEAAGIRLTRAQMLDLDRVSE